ncbi:hypothetical protein U1Q18_001238, partial [Sarracenia purpurea var. burkii]
FQTDYEEARSTKFSNGSSGISVLDLEVAMGNRKSKQIFVFVVLEALEPDLEVAFIAERRCGGKGGDGEGREATVRVA